MKEAFDFLVSHKEGDLPGVFHRDDLGDIDLVWGSDEEEKGLDHISKKHIERLKDFASVDEAQRMIEDIIRNGGLMDKCKAIFETHPH